MIVARGGINPLREPCYATGLKSVCNRRIARLFVYLSSQPAHPWQPQMMYETRVGDQSMKPSMKPHDNIYETEVWIRSWNRGYETRYETGMRHGPNKYETGLPKKILCHAYVCMYINSIFVNANLLLIPLYMNIYVLLFLYKGNSI